MFFATIQNAQDQEDLLQHILDTKNKIRTQREKKRLEKEKLNVKYGMLVNPITKHIESIMKIPESEKPSVPSALPDETAPAAPPEFNEPTQLDEITARNSSDVLQPINSEETAYQKALDSVEDTNYDDGFP